MMKSVASCHVPGATFPPSTVLCTTPVLRNVPTKLLSQAVMGACEGTGQWQMSLQFLENLGLAMIRRDATGSERRSMGALGRSGGP